jgi:catechol-2,3-dioxygenase
MSDFIFLSHRSAERAQTITIMTQPRAQHIAWEVDSQAALKAVYADARARGITIDRALDHRVTWSLYLHDPAGNGLEVFWATGQPANGLLAEPLDLSLLE